MSPSPDFAPPPRRLALDGVNFRRFAGRILTFLDDEIVNDVVAYDVEVGTIVRHARDSEGRKFLDRETFPPRVATETLHGAVQVAWK